MSYDERVSELGLNPDRADVIIPATKIYLNAMKWSGSNKIYNVHLSIYRKEIFQVFFQTSYIFY